MRVLRQNTSRETPSPQTSLGRGPRVVERAIDMHGRLEPGNLPGVVGLAAILVGLGKKEVPAGVQRVDFELVILQAFAVRVDENLEIVVAERSPNRGRESTPHVRLFHLGGDVKVLGVP